MDLTEARDLKGKGLGAITSISEFLNLLKIKIDSASDFESLIGETKASLESINKQKETALGSLAEIKRIADLERHAGLEYKQKAIDEANDIKAQARLLKAEAEALMLEAKRKLAEINYQQERIDESERKRRELEEKFAVLSEVLKGAKQ